MQEVSAEFDSKLKELSNQNTEFEIRVSIWILIFKFSQINQHL